MNHAKIRMLCEAAVLMALAQILSYIRLYEFPNGGSLDCAMLPIILFAVRYGAGWGTGVGFVYGAMQYFFANGISIDWTTIICDYFIAYAMLGLGAGLFHGKKNGVFFGALSGGILRFLAHLVVGAVVWGKWMPDEFFGMTMTNPWTAIENETLTVKREADWGLLSVFPMAGEARGVDEAGLQYPLDHAVLRPEVALGVSNHFMEETASVTVRDGALLVGWELPPRS